MGFISKLLIIAGKSDFELDPCIGIVYMVRLCWKYGWMTGRTIHTPPMR